MKNLSSLSTEELEKELERRKAEAESPVPKMLENPDLTKVKKFAQTIINDIGDNKGIDDDDEAYMLEEVLKAYFGENVYDDFINKRL